jgi:hypothetical protein
LLSFTVLGCRKEASWSINKGEAVRPTHFAAAWLLFASIGHSQTITAAQAREHDGETATVCGVAENEHTAATTRGKPTFIDLDSSFPYQIFSILVWDEDRSNVGELPHTGSKVCVTGVINYYHGVPRIVVKNSGQFGVAGTLAKR